MNKYTQEPEEIVDLHGHTTREAEVILRTILEKNEFRHIRVIVGRGNHSKSGPVLRDFVKAYLIQRNIRFNQSKIQHGGEGCLEVFLR